MSDTIFTLVLSIIDRIKPKQIVPEVLPSFENEDTNKCKDYNIDSIDLCKININFNKERNLSKDKVVPLYEDKIVPLYEEGNLYCDIV
jgi:hypothetical protein